MKNPRIVRLGLLAQDVLRALERSTKETTTVSAVVFMDSLARCLGYTVSERMEAGVQNLVETALQIRTRELENLSDLLANGLDLAGLQERGEKIVAGKSDEMVLEWGSDVLLVAAVYPWIPAAKKMAKQGEGEDLLEVICAMVHALANKFEGLEVLAQDRFDFEGPSHMENPIYERVVKTFAEVPENAQFNHSGR